MTKTEKHNRVKTILVGLSLLFSICVNAQVKEQLIGEGAKTTLDIVNKSQQLMERTREVPAVGVPYLGIFGGASHAYGEFARLKACIMGGISGFELFGGVGKEYIFNSDWKDRMTWHAGIGYYFTDGVISGYGEDTSNILSIDLVVGRTPLCSDIALMAQFEWDHWFGYSRRFGVFGALGVGLGELDNDSPKVLWDVSLGVAIKIFK